MPNDAVLIATNPDDIHAATVMLALREMGRKADMWFVGDLPTRSSASLSFGEANSSVTVSHWDGVDDLSAYATLWFRRLSAPYIPSAAIHPSDLAMALSESREHVRSVLQVASQSLVAVNHFERALHAEIKPNQLRVAAQVGMKLPRTLVSNDPDAIRCFIEDTGHSTGVVYKPYHTPIWQGPQDVAFGYTSKVTLDDLPSDETGVRVHFTGVSWTPVS